MKKLYFFLLAICLIVTACKGNETQQPLEKSNEIEQSLEQNNEAEQSLESGETMLSTEWKLVGIVDTETGSLRILEPKDCTMCYTLTFDTDTTAYGNTGMNEVRITGLNPLSIGLTKVWVDDLNVSIYEYEDALYSANSCIFNEYELKILFNNNKKYLLYKHIKQSSEQSFESGETICEVSTNETIRMYYDETGCFDKWGSSNIPENKKKQNIVKYFNNLGICIYDIQIINDGILEECKACFCKTGYRIHCKIEKNDLKKIKKENFYE